MDPLSFKLILKVPETNIIHSLISLVHERIKRISALLEEAKSIEIMIFQRSLAENGESPVVAEIKMMYKGGEIKKTSESKMWDAAFLNALDQVRVRVEEQMVTN